MSKEELSKRNRVLRGLLNIAMRAQPISRWVESHFLMLNLRNVVSVPVNTLLNDQLLISRMIISGIKSRFIQRITPISKSQYFLQYSLPLLRLKLHTRLYRCNSCFEVDIRIANCILQFQTNGCKRNWSYSDSSCAISNYQVNVFTRHFVPTNGLAEKIHRISHVSSIIEKDMKEIEMLVSNTVWKILNGNDFGPESAPQSTSSNILLLQSTVNHLPLSLQVKEVGMVEPYEYDDIPKPEPIEVTGWWKENT